MSKKDNIPLGVRQEFEDIDYWNKLSKVRNITLDNGEVVSEYEWMKKYMHEAYANNFDRQNNRNNILKTKEQKQWATRNNNNTNRDALNVIRKSGKMATLFHISETDFNEQKEDWEKVFTLSSYEKAAESLMQQNCEDLELDYSLENVKTILRTYFRIKKFITLLRRDMKNKKKRCEACNKSKLKTEFKADKRTKDGLRKVCQTCEEQNA